MPMLHGQQLPVNTITLSISIAGYQDGGSIPSVGGILSQLS